MNGNAIKESVESEKSIIIIIIKYSVPGIQAAIIGAGSPSHRRFIDQGTRFGSGEFLLLKFKTRNIFTILLCRDFFEIEEYFSYSNNIIILVIFQN